MRLLALWFVLVSVPAAAQDTLRLPVLQQAAIRQDARLSQLELEESATEFRLRNIMVERLPELRVTGEATRQSEVTEIPIALPNMAIPAPPKDRYEVALNAAWLLFDGGVLGARRGIEQAQLTARKAEVSAELYTLRMEVTEAFFNALVLQERLLEITAWIEDLEARLSEVRARAVAGAALPGDTAAVRAELLRAVQQRAEVSADRRAALAVLAALSGHHISEADILPLPDLEEEVARVRAITTPGLVEPGGAVALRVHPQYAVFDARRERLGREAALIRARSRPQLSAFGEYAYGRPGLQQFTHVMHDYWLGGVRVQWAPWNWGATDREVGTVRIQQQIVDTEEASFTDRLVRQIQKPLESMQHLQESLEIDEQIIVLREQLERQARAQFAERAITAAAYVDARTDLQEARIALVRHRAELARAQAQYLTTLGVELR